MTELDKFMQEAIERGRSTLNDHLTESGFVDDFNRRKSMETQVVRAMTDNPKYQGMRGSVIFPSENTRAGWADGVERLPDRHPRPRFASSPALSRQVDPVLAKHEQDWHYTGGEGTELAIKGAVEAVATSSRKRQEAIAHAIVRQNDELDWVSEQHDRAKESIDELRHERDYLRNALMSANAHIARLIDKLGGGGGGELVPAE
jgi:hypothetical protein